MPSPSSSERVSSIMYASYHMAALMIFMTHSLMHWHTLTSGAPRSPIFPSSRPGNSPYVQVWVNLIHQSRWWRSQVLTVIPHLPLRTYLFLILLLVRPRPQNVPHLYLDLCLLSHVQNTLHTNISIQPSYFTSYFCSSTFFLGARGSWIT